MTAEPGRGALSIVSGGQTGVDRGALDAALACGAACGGWCPAGRRAEDGTIPVRYPLTATGAAAYRDRTRANVRDADATLILSPGAPSGGTALTMQFARQLGRPYLVVDADTTTPEAAAEQADAFLHRHRGVILNVAGPRASNWAGGADYARAVVGALLARRGENVRAPTS